MSTQLRSVLAVYCLVSIAWASRAAGDEPAPKVQSPRFTVWAYKQAGGQWVKREERTLQTDDLAKARAYENSVNSYQGWMTKSNVPYAADKLGARDTSLMEAGWYVGSIKAVSRDGAQLTFVVEPTGRSVVVPLETERRLLSATDFTAAKTLIGKQITLLLQPRSRGLKERDELLFAHVYKPLDYQPLGDKLLHQARVRELMKDRMATQPESCEHLFGTLLLGDDRQRWVIGNLKLDDEIKTSEIRSQATILADGFFYAVGNYTDPLTFRHPDCQPLNLPLGAGAGLIVADNLPLVKFSLKNSGKLRLPLSDFAMEEQRKGRLPAIEVTRLGDNRSAGEEAVDSPVGKRVGNTLEFYLAPGEYRVHCFRPGHDRYLERLHVAIGETHTLPQLSFAPLTYVVVHFCEHDGTRSDMENKQQAYFVSDRYSHAKKHALFFAGLINYAGAEFDLHQQSSWITRADAGDIRLCFLPEGDVKIADLGEGNLRDYADLGGKDVAWKQDGELVTEKKNIAGLPVEAGGEASPAVLVGRSVPIRKGHVYRFDGQRKKYLVEVVEVTNHFPTYASLVKHVLSYEHAQELKQTP